eukprot:TRINITY_DN4564_c0_g2_i1.p1 TRINITY_DN4564_c0_g2~~TRINITY_DN4564_c0_g2_i1.p1  ORF type:complete len:954 (-),score=338.43 TRINITY_DN4564_c0_g2_i1:471-3332(-)
MIRSLLRESSWILFWAFLVYVVIPIAGKEASRQYENCMWLDGTPTDSGSNFFRLSWTLTDTELHASIEAPAPRGWAALGLSQGGVHPMVSSGKGIGSEIFVGWVDVKNKGHLGTYIAKVYEQPTLLPEKEQLARLVVADASGGTLRVEFKRILKPTNLESHREIDPSKPVGFIWAYNRADEELRRGDGTAFGKHEGDTRGYHEIDLRKSSVCASAAVRRPNEYFSPDGSFVVTWSVRGPEIFFEVTAATAGWVGLGFNHEPRMQGADMIVGVVASERSVYISDRHATAYSTPVMDEDEGGSSDVVTIGGKRLTDDSGKTLSTLRFSRRLVTDDKFDVQLSDKDIYLLWAYGDDKSVNMRTQQLAQHVNRGIQRVNLMSGCMTGAPVARDAMPRLIKLHGVLMVVGWLGCLAIGQFMARYLKAALPTWFMHHVWLQTLGVLMLLAGLKAAYNHAGGLHLSGPHQQLGMLVLVGAFAQPLLGVLAHLKWNPQRLAPPWWPDKVHWWVGRAAIVGAVINIFLGIQLAGSYSAAYVVVSVWLVACVGLFAYEEGHIGQIMRQAHGSPADDDVETLDSSERDQKRLFRARSRKMFSLFCITSIGFAFTFAYVLIHAPDASTAAAQCPKAPDDVSDVTGNAKMVVAKTKEQLCSAPGAFCVFFDKFPLPGDTTTWACKAFKFGDIPPRSITKLEVLVDHTQVVHHIVIALTETYFGDGYIPDCAEMSASFKPLIVWDLGNPPVFEMPADVGYRVGPGAEIYGLIQIHYDNPQARRGIKDSTGVVLTLSPVVKHTAGLLRLGAMWNRRMQLQPGIKRLQLNTTCTADETRLKFPDGIRIIGIGNHMHKVGRRIWVDHFRQVKGVKTQVGVFGCDDFFSFDRQRWYWTNFTVEPGDTLETHCIFDTTGRKEITYGGEESMNEMCINFITYYPKVESENCVEHGVKWSEGEDKLRCPEVESR